MKKALTFLLCAVLMLSVLLVVPTTADAANEVVRCTPNAANSEYVIYNLYSYNDYGATGATYSNNMQDGENLAQTGTLRKSHTPFVGWVVEAPEAGWYTVSPAYNVGNWPWVTNRVHNVVVSVNDTRYYVGKDLTSDSDGSASVKVAVGDDNIDVYLDKGRNVLRLLPFSGPDYVYRGTYNGETRGIWVDVMGMGIDKRLTIHKTEPLVLAAKDAPYHNYFTSESDYFKVSSIAAAREHNISFDNLCQENLQHVPYISYTLNAPADGYYDIDLQFTSMGQSLGNNGYFVVRVGGTNYRRWIGIVESGAMSVQNISVPLKKGDNTVTVTVGMGMKGGTADNNYELAYGGYTNINRLWNMTVRGGVTLSSTQVDPKTIADDPLPTAKIEAETYGYSQTFTATETTLDSGDLSGVSGLPTVRALWEGEWFDKAVVPTANFLVNAPKAGTYTVRAVYTLDATDGTDALNYFVTASANDSSYDKGRFEPSQTLSRTTGYSEMILELQEGVNTLRIMPVMDGNTADSFSLDYLLITGESTVTPVAPGMTVPTLGWVNNLDIIKNIIHGDASAVATYSDLVASNLSSISWISYTLDVPVDGYYDMQANVSGGSGMESLVMVIDGEKIEVPVQGGRELSANTVNLSQYFTAGEHTILITGILGESYTMNTLSVSGGITKSANQVDPATLGVQPKVREGGLIPGSVYVNNNCTLTGIPANTTGEHFKSNFRDLETVEFYNADGSAMADEDIITAGSYAIYPAGTCYNVKNVLTSESPRSIGADVILEMCNPVGRLLKNKNSVHMETSGGNITITGNLSGDVCMAIENDMKSDPETNIVNLFVEVDGIYRYFELGFGVNYLTIAEDLEPGEHTIRVLKGSDLARSVYRIHSISYTGTLEKAQAAPRRIELLGDSITAGCGVFSGDCQMGAYQSWYAYGHMLADAFGADYYSVANGGWRFTTTYKPESAIGTIYDDWSMHEAELGAYDFSWKPDVIIINLGTNDSIAYRSDKTNYSQASFAENIKILLDLVREKNPDSEIIWIYGSMLTENEAWIQAPVEEYAKTDSKVHYVSVRGNTKGYGDHPDFDGHTNVAKTMSQAISDIMGWELPVGTHATGDCDSTTCQYCIQNENTFVFHTYTNACDTQCDYKEANGALCEHTRVAPHQFTDCTDNVCDLCGTTVTAVNLTHSFTNSCSASCLNVRADGQPCGYTRPIFHAFDGCTDGQCNNCGETRTPAADHIYTADCDVSCNNAGCGFIRTTDVDHISENGICTVCSEAEFLFTVFSGSTQTGYSTLEDVLANYDPSTQYIKLHADVRVELSLTKDLKLDLNGHSMSGVIVLNGNTIYGVDSTTDAYTDDNIGYFNCVDPQGNIITPASHIKTDSATYGSIKRYLAVENEFGWSFHRFYFGVTHVSLRPENGGVGYRATFAGDTMVKAALLENNGFGLEISLNSDFSGSTTAGFNASAFASEGKSVTKRVLLSNVVTTSMTTSTQVTNANSPVYVRTYLKTADGTTITSSQISYSLKDVLEQLDEEYNTLDAARKLLLQQFYKNFRALCSNMTIPNIVAAVDGTSTGKKLIALTFDDGPKPEMADIVTTLNEYDAKATFFVIGGKINDSTSSYIADAYNSGHEIANHSYSHTSLSSKTAAEVQSEVSMTQNLVQNITGEAPAWFRAPFLSVSQTMYDNIDMPIAHYGVYAGDGSNDNTAQDRYDAVVGGAYDGAIALLHCNDITAEVLPEILEALQEKGYEFVTISDLFEQKGVTPNPNANFQYKDPTSK